LGRNYSHFYGLNGCFQDNFWDSSYHQNEALIQLQYKAKYPQNKSKQRSKENEEIIG